MQGQRGREGKGEGRDKRQGGKCLEAFEEPGERERRRGRRMGGGIIVTRRRR